MKSGLLMSMPSAMKATLTPAPVKPSERAVGSRPGVAVGAVERQLLAEEGRLARGRTGPGRDGVGAGGWGGGVTGVRAGGWGGGVTGRCGSDGLT